MLKLRRFFLENQIVFSDLSRLEVLGFHNLTPADQVSAIQIDYEIITRAIELRKSFKTKTADAIIAATAQKMNCSLLTANIDDFRKIENLTLVAIESALDSISFL